MAKFTNIQLDNYAEMLAEKVFQVDTKWPHFRQLLIDIRKLSNQVEENTKVVSLERGLLYGGVSLIAPFFQKCDFFSIDCSPTSAEDRGAYNEEMVSDKRFLNVPSNDCQSIDSTELSSNSADLVIVPNLVHHVKDQDMLFEELARITKPEGSVYIFEAILRELHQIPDDYLRYTPYGIDVQFNKVGMTVVDFSLEGGPFSAIAYCWVQALQYFPSDKRREMTEWFNKEHFHQLIKWDEEYKINQIREHTKFPVSFSVIAKKA